MNKSDLPFGSEFSPSQIELPRVLEFAHEYGGDWKKFEEVVRVEYFDSHTASEYNRRKLANNTKLGMIAYELIDRDVNLTDFGRTLYDLRNDEKKLYEAFGRHILRNLQGLTLVQCVQDIQVSGEKVTLVKLREWLEERGVHFPRGGKHPSIMRLWLEKAGVFGQGWRINEDRLQRLIGQSSEEIGVLAHFTPEQRAYLKTLANIDSPGPYWSNDIERLASTTYGVKFNEKNLPKQILYPLRDTGYIKLERGTEKSGRGAKPFQVYPTENLKKEVILPLIQQLDQQVGEELRRLLCKPFAEVLEELNAEDKHIRGLALEALAFKLMRLIDLTYVATRLRGSATAGAEVDLIFETDRLLYSRWQIQCKNTSRVSIDDVAKEVGLTYSLKSNAIVMVSTGLIGDEARNYANRIMQISNLCVIMIDKADIEAIANNPTVIVNVLNREAKKAMTLKKLEL